MESKVDVSKMRIDPELDDLTHVFTASIEPCNGPVFVHGFHLGTDRKVAEWFCEELFRRHNVHNGLYTVALMRNGSIVDIYDDRNWQHRNPWHPKFVP